MTESEGNDRKTKGVSRRGSALEKRFQQFLRSRREGAKLSQRELAEGIGIKKESANYISQLENGTRGASLSVVEEISRFFKVDPGDFFLSHDQVTVSLINPVALWDLLNIRPEHIEGSFTFPRSDLRGHADFDLIAVKVSGDAMAPAIRSGATVIVDIEDFPDRDPDPTNIYAFSRSIDSSAPDPPSENIFLLRHVIISASGQLTLLPSSIEKVSRYPLLYTTLRREEEKVKFVGRVIWVWQPY